MMWFWWKRIFQHHRRHNHHPRETSLLQGSGYMTFAGFLLEEIDLCRQIAAHVSSSLP